VVDDMAVGATTRSDATAEGGTVSVDDRDAPDGYHAPHGAARPSPLARPLLAMVRGYQTVRAGRPSPCRYWPSCSTYAVEALEVHGAVKGLGLAAWRVARCNPFGGHGVDPVPEKKARRV
jgi:putative membrane protein insertion efficiency factor